MTPNGALTLSDFETAVERVKAVNPYFCLQIIESTFAIEMKPGIIPIKLKGRGITILRKGMVGHPCIIRMGDKVIVHPYFMPAIREEMQKQPVLFGGLR